MSKKRGKKNNVVSKKSGAESRVTENGKKVSLKKSGPIDGKNEACVTPQWKKNYCQTASGWEKIPRQY